MPQSKPLQQGDRRGAGGWQHQGARLPTPGQFVKPRTLPGTAILPQDSLHGFKLQGAFPQPRDDLEQVACPAVTGKLSHNRARRRTFTLPQRIVNYHQRCLAAADPARGKYF